MVWEQDRRIPGLTPLKPQTIYYWIVRETSTGFVIPQERVRGGSWAEPTDPRGRNFHPRLFSSESVAKGWLTQWLKGTVIMENIGVGPEVMMRELKRAPVAGRQREFMEIKKVRIRL